MKATLGQRRVVACLVCRRHVGRGPRTGEGSKAQNSLMVPGASHLECGGKGALCPTQP